MTAKRAHRSTWSTPMKQMWSFRKRVAVIVIASAAVPSAMAETPLERGTYLVNTIGACGNCHSPVDANGNRSGPALSGGPALLSPVFEAYAPNITSGTKTGIGTWSEDQIVTALREGKRPDGRMLRPPMPIPLYASMSDADAHAIAAYLKTLPPSERETPVATYRVPMPASYGPPVVSVPEPAPGDPVAYGAYLGKLGHCMECHTPFGAGGRRNAELLGAGGMSVDLAWGSRVAANITPDPETGIGTWTDEQIVAALTHGVDKDGAMLSRIMPWPYLGAMKPEDLKAVVAWLRSLKPVRNAVAR